MGAVNTKRESLMRRAQFFPSRSRSLALSLYSLSLFPLPVSLCLSAACVVATLFRCISLDGNGENLNRVASRESGVIDSRGKNTKRETRSIQRVIHARLHT